MPSFIIVGYEWQILGKRGLFAPLPPLWAALRKPILNRVKTTLVKRLLFIACLQCCATGQWGKFRERNANFCLYILSWRFLWFLIKKFMLLSFFFFFFFFDEVSNFRKTILKLTKVMIHSSTEVFLFEKYLKYQI